MTEEELEAEMIRRTEIDGIPRLITSDGRIMKYDWELDSEWTDDLDVEEHIRKLLESAQE